MSPLPPKPTPKGGSPRPSLRPDDTVYVPVTVRNPEYGNMTVIVDGIYRRMLSKAELRFYGHNEDTNYCVISLVNNLNIFPDDIKEKTKVDIIMPLEYVFTSIRDAREPKRSISKTMSQPAAPGFH